MSPVDLQPCLSGERIAEKKELKNYVMLLKQLISAPNDVYETLYLATLYRFMEFCQALPLDAEGEPYGLVKWHLELTTTALKLRRGKMLPVNSDSETIAEQEPLWTYALFVAGLLVNYQHWEGSHCIELYKNANERLGIWHPMTGSLYESGAHYKLLSSPHPLQINTQLSQAMVIGRIVPAVGLRWLSSYAAVFSVWLDTIQRSIHSEQNNPLMQLLHQAASTVGFPAAHVDTVKNTVHNTAETTHDHLSASVDTKGSSPALVDANPPSLLDVLNDWLVISRDKLPADGKSIHCLRIAGGLLITVEALTAFLSEHSFPISVESLVALLKISFFGHESSDKNKLLPLCYRSSHIEKRQIIKGFMLKETHLNAALKTLPIQTDFILDVPL